MGEETHTRLSGSGESGTTSIPKYNTRTETVIHEMLVENTGRILCDSGDAYGRSYQKNRKVGDFRRIPDVFPSQYAEGEFEMCRSLFAFLSDQLHYDESMNAEFEKFDRKTDPENKMAWLELAEAFAEKMQDDDDIGTVNTYNEETSALSEIIQYCTFRNDDGEYVILQIHGGCDARYGYTKPRVFSINEMGGHDVFASNMRSIDGSCECCESRTFDGGLEWETTANDGQHVDESFPSAWNAVLSRDGNFVECARCHSRVSFY